jgi:transcriptional regulator with XRE-family HTH domain
MKDKQTQQAPRKANALDAHVGIRLKERRLALGLSQYNLGDVAGIAEQQIQKYEVGKDRISASRLFLLARMLGVTTDWFFEGFRDTSEGAKPEGETKSKLERDVVTLLESYRSIGDKAEKDEVLKIARSFARKHE